MAMGPPEGRFASTAPFGLSEEGRFSLGVKEQRIVRMAKRLEFRLPLTSAGRGRSRVPSPLPVLECAVGEEGDNVAAVYRLTFWQQRWGRKSRREDTFPEQDRPRSCVPTPAVTKAPLKMG